mmetsp:Transcript_59234/g.145412  ORF Transcript_59234/g.145412 Transcript_59234/m.145412 type:complete len:236 (-) Transcript_59234:92-799(-)
MQDLIDQELQVRLDRDVCEVGTVSSNPVLDLLLHQPSRRALQQCRVPLPRVELRGLEDALLALVLEVPDEAEEEAAHAVAAARHLSDVDVDHSLGAVGAVDHCLRRLEALALRVRPLELEDGHPAEDEQEQPRREDGGKPREDVAHSIALVEGDGHKAKPVLLVLLRRRHRCHLLRWRLLLLVLLGGCGGAVGVAARSRGVVKLLDLILVQEPLLEPLALLVGHDARQPRSDRTP